MSESRLERYGSWLACCLGQGTQAPLSGSDLELLTDEMGERCYAAGTSIFERGQPAAQIHVVGSGCVELSRAAGGRRVVVQVLHPGDVFGDVPALLGAPEPFDARAIEDSTVLSFDTEALMVLLQTRSKVARRWFVSMAERMSGLQARLMDLLAGGIESQLASILLRETAADGAVHLTHGHLAELLGVPRSSAQRVLKSLEEGGFVKLRYRKIELLDRPGLLSLVGDEPHLEGGMLQMR
jgi:CRP-like cAMP-binding protein